MGLLDKITETYEKASWFTKKTALGASLTLIASLIIFFTPQPIKANSAPGHIYLGLRTLKHMNEHPEKYKRLKTIYPQLFEILSNPITEEYGLNKWQQSFLKGCNGPDLPMIASEVHYKKPGLMALRLLKTAMNEKDHSLRGLYVCYSLGWLSHYAADGITHPFMNLPDEFFGPRACDSKTTLHHVYYETILDKIAIIVCSQSDFPNIDFEDLNELTKSNRALRYEVLESSDGRKIPIEEQLFKTAFPEYSEFLDSLNAAPFVGKMAISIERENIKLIKKMDLRLKLMDDFWKYVEKKVWNKDAAQTAVDISSKYYLDLVGILRTALTKRMDNEPIVAKDILVLANREVYDFLSLYEKYLDQIPEILNNFDTPPDKDLINGKDIVKDMNNEELANHVHCLTNVKHLDEIVVLHFIDAEDQDYAIRQLIKDKENYLDYLTMYFPDSKPPECPDKGQYRYNQSGAIPIIACDKHGHLPGALIIFLSGSIYKPVKEFSDYFKEEHSNLKMSYTVSSNNKLLKKISDEGMYCDVLILSSVRLFNGISLKSHFDWRIGFGINWGLTKAVEDMNDISLSDKPILFGLSIPKGTYVSTEAEAYVRELLSEDGMRIFSEHDIPVLQEFIVRGENIPYEIRKSLDR